MKSIIFLISFIATLNAIADRPSRPNVVLVLTDDFYCAMVEQLDTYVGKLFAFLEATEDPRWPGHRLSENTYVIQSYPRVVDEQHPGKSQVTFSERALKAGAGTVGVKPAKNGNL